MPQAPRRLAIAAALLIGAVLGYRGLQRALPRPAAPAPSAPAASAHDHDAPRWPPAGPAELALVSPLAEGSDLVAGFVVREIHGVERGYVRVVCAHDRAIVKLDVALADPEGTLPPASAGRYAIFYSLRGAAPEDGERLAKKLAKVIDAHLAVDPPPGMTTFTPDPTPSIDL